MRKLREKNPKFLEKNWTNIAQKICKKNAQIAREKMT